MVSLNVSSFLRVPDHRDKGKAEPQMGLGFVGKFTAFLTIRKKVEA
jgi:hypothetical protein